MQLNWIRLKNFRRFEDTRLDFDDRFNLILGDNAAGKTSLLEGMAVAVGSWLLKIPDQVPRHIRPKDVRVETRSTQIDNFSEPIFPTVVESQMTFDGTECLTWSRSLHSFKGRTRAEEAQGLKQLAELKAEQVKSGDRVDLPLLCYYGSGRLWREPNQGEGKRKKPSRFDGYERSIDPRINTARFISWMKKQAYAHLQDGQSDAYLAVCEAISNCFVDRAKVEYNVRRDQLEATVRGETISYEQMSDGQRSIVSLVGDIAYRSLTLNPNNGPKALKEIHGVVLIDELDLHLHPKWQRKIVDVLTQAFPRLQFIATTHSPFVIQGMHHGKVINLDKPSNIETQPGYNRSIEEIVEFIQGVKEPHKSARHHERTELAQKFLTRLSEANSAQDVDKMSPELQDMLLEFSDDPATSAALKFEQMAAKLDKSGS